MGLEAFRAFLAGPSHRAASPPSQGTEEGRLEWGGGGSFGQTQDDNNENGARGGVFGTAADEFVYPIIIDVPVGVGPIDLVNVPDLMTFRIPPLSDSERSLAQLKNDDPDVRRPPSDGIEDMFFELHWKQTADEPGAGRDD